MNESIFKSILLRSAKVNIAFKEIIRHTQEGRQPLGMNEKQSWSNANRGNFIKWGFTLGGWNFTVSSMLKKKLVIRRDNRMVFKNFNEFELKVSLYVTLLLCIKHYSRFSFI